MSDSSYCISAVRFNEQQYKQKTQNHKRFFSHLPLEYSQIRQEEDKSNYTSVKSYMPTRKSSICSNSKNNDDVNYLQKEHKILFQKSKLLLQTNTTISKQQKIRINQWLNKLSLNPSNLIWKQNINFYLKVLNQMLLQNRITEPFSNLPPQGPLLKLTIYDISSQIRQNIDCKNNTSKKKYIQASKDKNQQNFVNDFKILEKINFNKNQKDRMTINFVEQIRNTAKQNDQLNSRYFNNMIGDQSYCQKEVKIDMLKKNNLTNQKRTINKTANKSRCGKNIKNTCENIKILKCEKHKDQFDADNKQNNSSIINVSQINRRLFNSKQKIQTKRFQQLKHDQEFEINNNSNQLNQNQKTFNDQNTCDSFKQSRAFSKIKQTNIKCFQILMKVAKFLLKSQNKQKICQSEVLLDQINNLGQRMNMNLALEDSQDDQLDNSILSEKSKAFTKFSQKIKQKFYQTDQQTTEFLQFLQNIKEKQMN